MTGQERRLESVTVFGGEQNLMSHRQNI